MTQTKPRPPFLKIKFRRRVFKWLPSPIRLNGALKRYRSMAQRGDFYYRSKPGITPAMREVAEKATKQFIADLRAGKV